MHGTQESAYKATFTHARSGCGAEAGGFWYSRSATAGMFTHTRSGRGRICHFLRTMMVWSARFRSGRGKLGVGPISCGVVFAPAPPPLRDRACVNACNDLCWSQFQPLRYVHTCAGGRGRGRAENWLQHKSLHAFTHARSRSGAATAPRMCERSFSQDRNNAMCYFGLRKLTILNYVPISKLNFIPNYHIYFMKYQSLCYDIKMKYNDSNN